MEKLIAERMARLANIALTSELEQLLIDLVKSAKAGHLCHRVEDISVLPRELYGEGKPLILQDNRLYLQRNWALETAILQKVSELLLRRSSEPRWGDEVANIVGLQESQRSALLAVSHTMFALFSGGPGTGKTFTAACLVRLLLSLREKPLKVVLSAPTGKAAAHLEHALRGQGPLNSKLKCEAMTLHRLLKLQPGVQKLSRQETIDADLVIVDEASMLDALLLLHLLNAIGPQTRLVLLGDPDQLPPIEGGALFAELAELFGQRLECSMRMGRGALFACSQAVRNGVWEGFDHESIGERTPSEWVDWIIDKLPNPILPYEPKPSIFQPFQVLCALRQGPLGSDALNRAIVERFERQLTVGLWFVMPIMIVQNDSHLQLYNGTIGILVKRGSGGPAMAYFDGEKKVPALELPRYEPAFCLSIHKSQGSEYEEVALLFPPGSERFGREALYTGITRAKKKVHLAIEPATLEHLLKISSKTRSGFIERYLTRACNRDLVRAAFCNL